MKIIVSLKYISALIFILISSNSFGCGVKTPSYINLAISTVEEKIFSYGVKSIDEKMPLSIIAHCRDTAIKKRFVMISFGPNIVDVSDNLRGNNFNKEYGEPTCSIQNNPLSKIQSTESRKHVFEKKWKYINDCVEVTVTEGGPRPLSFPEDQLGCKITSVSDQSATFSGGFCFFSPRQDSELRVSVGVKESCKSINGLKKYNMNILELEAELSFFTSSGYKDDIDMMGIGTAPVRLTTNPMAFLFKASDDFGILRPSFPGDFPVNDIHLGKIEIEETSDTTAIIKTPFIVNNVCKQVEKNGIVSSICDYSNPYIGEFKLINSKGVIEAQWYDGGVAPIQWQGILNGEGESLSKEILRKNERYKMEISFSDPYFEFNTFKKRIKSRFSRLNPSMPELMAGDGITSVSEIPTLGIYDEIVEMDSIGDINFERGISDLSNSRKRLNTFFSSSLFPPMYEKACIPETGECAHIGIPFVKFISTFKVNDDYSISELEVERVSKLLGSYKKKITKQSSYVCK